MNRNEFLKKSLFAGFACCGAASSLLAHAYKPAQQAILPAATGDEWLRQLEKRMIKGSESPAWHKVEKGERWLKDLMDNMDALLDEETKVRLMQACGRSCYINAFGVTPEVKPTPEQAERFVKSLKESGNEIKIEGDKTVIIFNWGRNHQNPQGLILSDGYCMCPLVETGPPDLSPSFCHCSSGYVKEIFTRGIGKTTTVTVLDSLKKGGKDCIFKIEIVDL